MRGPRRAVRLLVAAAIAAASLLVGPAAGAGELTGCSGSATSLDADGAVLDTAVAAAGRVEDTTDGGEGFTAKNPFLVDNEGVVQYQGRSDAVITDHTWSVKVYGITVAQGGSANAQRTQEDSGDFDLAEEMPFPITGLAYVTGEVAGAGGKCSGSGYVEVQGNALASPLTWMGGLLGALGVAGVVMSRPKVPKVPKAAKVEGS